MLGLRHYNGFAIDLWQGEIEDFSTDILVHCLGQDEALHPKKIELERLSRDPAAVFDHEAWHKGFSDSLTVTKGGNFPAQIVIHLKSDCGDKETDYSAAFHAALTLNFRHLTVWPIFSSRAEELCIVRAQAAFTALKLCLDQRANDGKSLGRISFVLPNLQVYAAFQKVFFVIFPEAF
jgi:hypothetical protein